MPRAAPSEAPPEPAGLDLVRLSLALVGRTRLDELLAVALEALEARSPDRRWAIVERLDRREFRARASRGVTAEDLSRLLARACGRQVFFWSDAPRTAGLPWPGPRWCAIPQGDPAGGSEPGLVLACWSRPGRGSIAPSALEQAARLVAGAARSARVVEHLLEQTSTDPLTGLLNRRGLQETLQREVALAERHGSPLSVLFADLDGFKEINDEHGHPVGDEALQGVAQVLGAELRSSDAIGRIGGDEFVIVLPRTDLAGARLIAARLRALVARAVLPSAAGPLSIGLSIGASSLDEGPGVEGLIELADRRMMRQKSRRGPALRPHAPPPDPDAVLAPGAIPGAGDP